MVGGAGLGPTAGAGLGGAGWGAGDAGDCGGGGGMVAALAATSACGGGGGNRTAGWGGGCADVGGGGDAVRAAGGAGVAAGAGGTGGAGCGDGDGAPFTIAPLPRTRSTVGLSGGGGGASLSIEAASARPSTATCTDAERAGPRSLNFGGGVPACAVVGNAPGRGMASATGPSSEGGDGGCRMARDVVKEGAVLGYPSTRDRITAFRAPVRCGGPRLAGIPRNDYSAFALASLRVAPARAASAAAMNSSSSPSSTASGLPVSTPVRRSLTS